MTFQCEIRLHFSFLFPFYKLFVLFSYFAFSIGWMALLFDLSELLVTLVEMYFPSPLLSFHFAHDSFGYAENFSFL